MKLKDNAFIVRWNLRRYGTPPSRDVLPPSRDLLVYYNFLFFKCWLCRETPTYFIAK